VQHKHSVVDLFMSIAGFVVSLESRETNDLVWRKVVVQNLPRLIECLSPRFRELKLVKPVSDFWLVVFDFCVEKALVV